MTTQQIEILHKEYEQKFADYTSYDDIDGYLTARGAMWQWIESKLESVEEEVNDEPSWRCGKCEQEEMRSKGIAIPCPIPEHSIRCSLRKSNKLKDKDGI